MNVQSRPITTRRSSVLWERLPTALLGWFFLSLWWIVGAKYTIDGLPMFLNTMVFQFLHIPIALPNVTDWHWYLYLAWLPVLISIVERRNRPRLALARSAHILYALGVWIIVCGIDLGSTWMAVTNPPDDAFRISQQVARIGPLALIWTAITTFLPEIGFGALWRYLRS